MTALSLLHAKLLLRKPKSANKIFKSRAKLLPIIVNTSQSLFKTIKNDGWPVSIFKYLFNRVNYSLKFQ